MTSPEQDACDPFDLEPIAGVDPPEPAADWFTPPDEEIEEATDAAICK